MEFHKGRLIDHVHLRVSDLAASARDDGGPGERGHDHPGCYAAFVLDPDGQNIEAAHHGPVARSAPSVMSRPAGG